MDPTLKLVMLQGPLKGETLEFSPRRPTIKIGRLARGNTVQIKDNGVSSKHLAIEFVNSKWVISDLDSSNGTIVNNLTIKPFNLIELHDGDTVKIGEYTSIEVRLDVNDKVNDESRRRNPRRRAAAKFGENEDKIRVLKEEENNQKDCEIGIVGEIEEEWHNGKLELGKGNRRGKRNNRVEKDENNDVGIVGLVEGNRSRRVGLKRKDDDGVVEDLGLKGAVKRGRKVKGDSDNFDNVGLEKVDEVVENRGRRGGLRKGRVLKEKTSEVELDLSSENCVNENVEVKKGRGRPKRAKVVAKCDVVEGPSGVWDVEEKENVDISNEVEKQNGSLMNKRSVKKEKLSFAELMPGRIEDISCLDNRQLEIDNNRESVDEALEVVDVGSSGMVENVEVLDPKIDSNHGPEEKNTEPSDLGQERGEELGSGSGVKVSIVDASNEVDLEKMTLGEWLDYLEVYLPKQIYDATEEMIACMEDKARRFHEFVAHQHNEKGKMPIG